VQNVELVVLTIVGCVLWNLIAFFAFAKRMFPNFWCVVPLPSQFPKSGSLPTS
jgi:Na+/glutamate symporter